MTSEIGPRIAIERWLGIPWVLNGESRQGCDCWGLVKLVYRDELGIGLTHPSAMSTAEAAERARRVAEIRELVLGEAVLRPVPEGERLEEFDILELAFSGGAADHVGVVAGGMLLQSRRRLGSHRVALDEIGPAMRGAWRRV